MKFWEAIVQKAAFYPLCLSSRVENQFEITSVKLRFFQIDDAGLKLEQL
jgi:hypothetical protein